jgi:AcrR family transcriptional regulator
MPEQTLTTGKRLVEAAAALLDNGGEAAVTLRAVAQAVGVSHNTPYRHFADRAALLAAVAERDFTMLTDAFTATDGTHPQPLAKVKDALDAFVVYGETYPARYRLLFSDPGIASRGGELEAAAMRSFAAFAKLIKGAQASGDLPATIPTATLTGLVFATVHGLLDLQAGGRMREEKGLSKAAAGVAVLLELIAPRSGPVSEMAWPSGP